MPGPLAETHPPAAGSPPWGKGWDSWGGYGGYRPRRPFRGYKPSAEANGRGRLSIFLLAGLLTIVSYVSCTWSFCDGHVGLQDDMDNSS